MNLQNLLKLDRLMNIEIERKFLVNNIPANISKTVIIKQYYIFVNEKIVQRLRFFNDEKAILSFKERNSSLSKYEFEYAISFKDAEKLVSFFDVPCISKKRHYIELNSLKWEVDEFLDKNKGLIIAEVELDKPNQKIKIPKWANSEVSKDEKYSNFNLALHPFTLWEDKNE